MTDKDEYIQNLLHLYDDANRIGFCRLALQKFRFEKYKISDNNIDPSDYIIKDLDVIRMINNCLGKNYCSKDELENILGKISYEDLIYIGI